MNTVTIAISCFLPSRREWIFGRRLAVFPILSIPGFLGESHMYLLPHDLHGSFKYSMMFC
jgi:hypothetical protein